jgi:hypothetical protein
MKWLDMYGVDAGQLINCNVFRAELNTLSFIKVPGEGEMVGHVRG